MKRFTIGLDFGTSSVRGVLVDVSNGYTAAEAVFPYPHGTDGVLIDAGDSNLARQHPQDHIDGLQAVIRSILNQGSTESAVEADQVIGIGVDTTGSTPIPVDQDGTPLGLRPEFAQELDAMVWLWKDHTAFAEAADITAAARELHPEYLGKIGGTYSSEWFWAKILKCARSNPRVSAAAATWVEHADLVPAILTGNTAPDRIPRGICAAGHKGLFHESWGGYPDRGFLAALHPELGRIRDSLPAHARTAEEPAGYLTPEWAGNLGLPEGIPVAVGAFDAHFGAVGAGVGTGVLVKNIGTSCCDITLADGSDSLPDIPGLCGIVPGSVLPGFHGLEAGQSAIGDIFNWFAKIAGPGRPTGEVLADLEDQARRLRPGQSGLLALDWQNGNRTVLVDQRLTGLFVGLTLHSTPAEMYRALVEATAFGARVIVERFEEYGVNTRRVLACGGIPYKSPMLMQIYADVLGKPMELSRSTQTAALGSAVAAAVTAGADRGGYDDFSSAMGAMTGTLDEVYTPDPSRHEVYTQLYGIYRNLHDAFGVPGAAPDLYAAMKRLLDIKDRS